MSKYVIMETRTIKQLLTLMLKHKYLFKEGLCKWVISMADIDIITREEFNVLINFIKENRPEYKWHNPYMLFNDTSSFYWICGCIAPRVKWIKKHIKLLEV